MSLVSLYSSAGWAKDLKALNTPRYNHGCASYTDSSGEEVGVVVISKYYVYLNYAGAAGGGGHNEQHNGQLLVGTEHYRDPPHYRRSGRVDHGCLSSLFSLELKWSDSKQHGIHDW